MTQLTLYGAPFSLFTGRARSYLIKAGIDYREVTPTTSHYAKVVVPKAGGRAGIPTVEFTDGEVIRDGAAIIEHFESATGHTFSPVTPCQRIVSNLFDVIGAEGLLRPAMHYRWNFPEQNLEFLRFHFESVMPRVENRAAKAEAARDRMRDAGKSFGVNPETYSLVESLYADLRSVLDAHFGEHPYLLGDRPSIGDFGMIAPLYGHLGRDPMPLSLMQADAIRLYRWVERMNRPETDAGEFEHVTDQYLPEDEVPDTLVNVLKQLALDFVPETRSAAACINAWIDDQAALDTGTTAERGVGFASFEVEGAPVTALAQPYRFYLLQRVQDEYDAADAGTRKQVSALLSRCDLQEVLDMRLSRRIGRDNNLEVWL